MRLGHTYTTRYKARFSVYSNGDRVYKVRESGNQAIAGTIISQSSTPAPPGSNVRTSLCDDGTPLYEIFESSSNRVTIIVRENNIWWREFVIEWD